MKGCIWAIVVSMVLLMGACGKQREVEPPLDTQAAAAEATTDGSQKLVILVDQKMNPVFYTAAHSFAQRVADITDNTVNISVRTISNAAEAFSSGNGQIVFLDSYQDREYCKYFKAVSMPFLYKSYQNFTMTVNTPQLLSMLGEDMSQRYGARPIAGYYQPGKQLLTTWQVTSYLQFSGKTIGVDPGSDAGLELYVLGSDLVEIDKETNWVKQFQMGHIQGKEVMLEDIVSTDLGEDVFYLTMSYHDLKPVWLTVNNSVMEQLSPSQQAAITEAAAYLFSDIDGVFLDQEQALFEGVRKQVILPREDSNDFDEIRSLIWELIALIPDTPVGVAERYVLELVNQI